MGEGGGGYERLAKPDCILGQFLNAKSILVCMAIFWARLEVVRNTFSKLST